MLVPKIKAGMSKYTQFILCNCERLIKSVRVHSAGYIHHDTAQVKRAEI